MHPLWDRLSHLIRHGGLLSMYTEQFYDILVHSAASVATQLW